VPLLRCCCGLQAASTIGHFIATAVQTSSSGAAACEVQSINAALSHGAGPHGFMQRRSQWMRPAFV